MLAGLNRAGQSQAVTLAERIRRAMEVAGYGDRGGTIRLAKDSGVSKGQISHLCNGKRGKEPEVETLTKLATALGVRLSWLANEEGEAKIIGPGELSNRELAVEFARRSGYPLAIVQAVARDHHDGCEDWTPEEWFDEIKGYNRRHKKVAEATDEIYAPPPGARK